MHIYIYIYIVAYAYICIIVCMYISIYIYTHMYTGVCSSRGGDESAALVFSTGREFKDVVFEDVVSDNSTMWCLTMWM